MPSLEGLHRLVLWMYYLNDVEVGGETEFYFQKRAIRPRKGTVVIAPAGFTHTHRGNVPLSGDKYIITSWLLYNRADKPACVHPRPPGRKENPARAGCRSLKKENPAEAGFPGGSSRRGRRIRPSCAGTGGRPDP